MVGEVCHMISSTCINNPCIIPSKICHTLCVIRISTYFYNARGSDGSFFELLARLSIEILPFWIAHNFIALFLGVSNFTTVSTGV